MLQSLTLTNFRGFQNHNLPFKPMTVIVGRNNAGKSTIVEALRLVSLVASRYRRLSYSSPPDWLDVPRSHFGVSPSLKGLEINLRNVFHNYEEPPAIIEAAFTDGRSVKIYIGPESSLHAVLFDDRGRPIVGRSAVTGISLPTVNIMPQVGPVASEEVILTSDYIRSAMSSPLAPLHFRNQLREFYGLFPEFQRLAEETWPSLQVKELSPIKGLPRERLYLHIRNKDFVGEVSMMGHGLQMWLQTMWFLTHAHESSTVILDEPDVYMHPDLQRRLIRFLRGRFSQVVLTTHSVEIMSEADPGDILVIDRRLRKSKFAGTLPAVQRILEGVGSAQNVHLARLWSARKFLLVEGKDIKFLRHFQDRIFPDAAESFEAIPNMAIGGWGGWPYAVGGSMVLQNAMGEDIKVYCVLDSDQHTEEEIEKRYETARAKGVQLHVWRRKEIENYMLCVGAIIRVIAGRCSAGSGERVPTEEEVCAKLDEIAESLRDEALDDLSSAIMAQERKIAAGTANKRARAILKKQIDSGGLLAVVSGKGMFSALAVWTQQEFGTSISAAAVARTMKADEIPHEMVQVIKAIELGKNFD
jgi:hypothetical protein